MYYDKEERSLETLQAVVRGIKPYKLIKKSERYWQPNEFEGYDVSMVQSLVDEIEEHTVLTVEQKVNLERNISRAITKTHYNNIHRGAYNVLLMVQNGATAFTRGHKLTSLQGLKKHALVYTKYIETTKTISVPAIEGVMGSQDMNKSEKVYVYVLSLTEYGKTQARQLAWTAERIARNEKRKLQKLNMM